MAKSRRKPRRALSTAQKRHRAPPAKKRRALVKRLVKRRAPEKKRRVPVKRRAPEKKRRVPVKRRAPEKKRRAPKAPPGFKRHIPPRGESELVLAYYRDVLHSTCAQMRDEGLHCQVRTHHEGDDSISGEIVVPVPPPGTDHSAVRLLLITLEELDGWSAVPAPRSCWISMIFRVDVTSGEDNPKYPVRVAPGRGTYNVATNYHFLTNAAYAFQIARDEILPGLLAAGRAIVAIIMRVRYLPGGQHPTRPRT